MRRRKKIPLFFRARLVFGNEEEREREREELSFLLSNSLSLSLCATVIHGGAP